MRLVFAILFFLFFFTENSYCQTEMTKDDIFEAYTKYEKTSFSEGDSLPIIRSNDELEYKIRSIIDSLQDNNFDSILVLSKVYHGLYGMMNTCISVTNPITVYVFWQENDQTFIRKIEDGCDTEIKHTEKSTIFDYWKINQTDLRNEIIMPPFYSATMSADSIMTSKGGSLYGGDEEYSLNYFTGEIYMQQIFSVSVFSNTKSLFYSDNLKLKTYEWFKLIENTIKEIYQKE